MPWLKTFDQVRAQDFAKEYLWDIYFPSFAGETGMEWFPAVDVEQDLAVVNSQEYQFAHSSYKVPINTAAQEIQITFAEFADRRVGKWLLKWYNDIFPAEGRTTGTRVGDSIRRFGVNSHVATLEEASREVTIEKLFPWAEGFERAPANGGMDRRVRKVSARDTYMVYPEGNYRYHGSSESSPELVTQTFVITGRL